ncbi:hypothetical protein BpHYR1_023692, partial [Brachionus plicatilis]
TSFNVLGTFDEINFSEFYLSNHSKFQTILNKSYVNRFYILYILWFYFLLIQTLKHLYEIPKKLDRDMIF